MGGSVGKNGTWIHIIIYMFVTPTEYYALKCRGDEKVTSERREPKIGNFLGPGASWSKIDW